MLFAIIADDDTGATDAAGMLTSLGARVALLLDPKVLADSGMREHIEQVDVVVLGTGTRSIDPSEAYTRTYDAVLVLRSLGARAIQLKYCSTFDSTRQGNIGQSLDAARKAMGYHGSVIVCPALPVNGRTTCHGYHFVHGMLLSESPMRDHPLNPMSDANLVRWLGYQTAEKVGLVDIGDVRGGVERIRERRRILDSEGVVYHVADTLEQDDIDTLVGVYGDDAVLSGGSGITLSLGRLAVERGELDRYRSQGSRLQGSVGRLRHQVVAICGSASPTTRVQKQRALESGFFGITLGPLEILDGLITAEEIAQKASTAYEEGLNVMVTLAEHTAGECDSADRNDRIGPMLSEFLGRVSRSLVYDHGIQRLVVAGGETSGAVCEACELQALEVGSPIDPGVPFCLPLDGRDLLVVLKSGNFGRPDLFAHVAELV